RPRVRRAPVPRALLARARRAVRSRRPSTLGVVFAPFRSRRFAALWSAGLVSNAGSFMQLATVPFVLDRITHSSALLGVDALATPAPAGLWAPVAGACTDLYPRRAVLLAGEIAMTVPAIGLFVLSTTGGLSRGAVIALVAAGAFGNGIHQTTFIPL